VSFRVIYHESVCPDCGSDDITTEDVPTGDGITETAHVCNSCHTAWPVACISDWGGTP
jgi:RNA polymerase subunit RPABC4/transcription elongation factor Spt4